MPENGSSQRGSILPIRGENLLIERQGRLLLDVPEIEIGQPGITTLLGHNGAGKSLLLKTLTGLISPDSGSVTWGGKMPSRQDYRRLGYMKQNAVLLRRSARANLEYVFMLAGETRSVARTKADETLAQFGLEALADTSARLLSGGEKQRLALARMLVMKPEIVVMDEPTASLDPVSTKSIEGVILTLKERGIPVFLVTHNLNQAQRLADDIIFLDQARILTRQSASSFFSKPHHLEAVNFLGA